jgi:peptidoglycan/xylan/chitin deacetylase (PgdA/CDA1 family)
MRLALALAAAFGAAFVGVSHVEPSGAPRRETPPPLVPLRPPTARPAPHPSRRPPQFVIVSFDGAGGTRLWPYWRSVARRAHAHFTFFVSGVYLLAEERRNLYRAPRHPRGVSDIWFARPEGKRPAREVVRGTLEQIAAAYREGHEIGTHFDGHFCEPYPGNVDEWTAADWNRELDQFDRLLFRASRNNGLRPVATLPFGPREIAGERTPCLQGRLPVLYRVLARRGYRYDASALARLGTWPQRRLGIWSVPLLEIPFVGHDFPVVSMDYNFFANQTGGVSAGPAAEAGIERETYLSLRTAFRTSYRGNRAPLSFANHFETWNHWAYNRALSRFVLESCRLRDVRCVTFRELVDWLEARPPGRLRRFRVYRP